MAVAEWHGGAAGRCWRGGGGRDGGGPAGVAVAGVKAAGEAAAAGVSSAGTVAVGVALAGAGQWSSRSVAAAVWPRQQLGAAAAIWSTVWKTNPRCDVRSLHTWIYIVVLHRKISESLRLHVCDHDSIRHTSGSGTGVQRVLRGNAALHTLMAAFNCT